MANYIQLFNKVTGEPEAFQTIDEKLCAALNVPCDENRYYCGWYDAIGYGCVNTVKELIERRQSDERIDVELIQALQWIDENYSLNAWCSR